MDARATRRGVPAVVIWSGFGVLAWAALTVLTGGGSAHADEQPDGPLDGLTSVVDKTVTAVTAPVTTQVVAPVVDKVVAPVVDKVVAPVVTQAVAPVVKAAVAPVQQAAPAVVSTVTETVAQVPVVGSVAAPVVEAVSDTAEAVVTPVTDTLTDSPVSQITDPILDAVSGLPIVGDVVTDIGAVDLIDDVVGIVDDATGLVGGVAEETLPPILEALEPAVPGGVDGPSTPGTPGTASAPRVLAVSTSGGYHPLSSAGVTVSTLPATPDFVPPRAGDPAAGTGDAPTAPTPGAPPGGPAAPTSSAGPGGASASAHARPSDVGVPPLRAWERASGATDDALPGSPVADTDVSPD